MSIAAANRATLRKLATMAVVMFGFGFALVPLYEKICAALGVNDIARADAVKNTQVDVSRSVTLQFDTNVRELPWAFRPLQRSVEVHPGALVQVVFEVVNRSDAKMYGQAIPSFGPEYAARYVKKVECFCFARQEVEPHATRQLPVTLVIDPELPAEISVITLSYTFFELPAGAG
jgi:cytochrome c oxidase assembly protein subunit 11